MHCSTVISAVKTNKTHIITDHRRGIQTVNTTYKASILPGQASQNARFPLKNINKILSKFKNLPVWLGCKLLHWPQWQRRHVPSRSHAARTPRTLGIFLAKRTGQLQGFNMFQSCLVPRICTELMIDPCICMYCPYL